MTSLREAIEGVVPIHSSDEQVESSWSLVDPFSVDDEDEGQQPTILRRTDGQALWYPGQINALHGETGSAKSWIALAACKEMIDAGDHVLYLDFEADYRSVRARLRSLGLDIGDLHKRFHYMRPRERIKAKEQARLREVLVSLRPGLVVIDGVTNALALEGLKEGEATDISAFRHRLSGPCASTGAAVVEIDHVVKAKGSRGLYPRGATTKLDGIEGATYVATMSKKPERGVSGIGRMVVAKDRHGFVGAAGKIAATVHLAAQPDGCLTITLTNPAEPAPEKDRRAILMEQLSQEIEADPGVTTELLWVAVKGDNNVKSAALKQLLTEDYVEMRRERQARLYYSVRPYRCEVQSKLESKGI